MAKVRASVLLVLTAALSLVLALASRRSTPILRLPGETLAVWG